MNNESTMATIAALLDARDEESLATNLHKAAASLGFDRFVLGVEINRPLLGKVQHVTSGYPVAWQKIYQERNYIERDPTVEHCRTNTSPLLWTDQLRGGSSADLWEEARSFGISFGLSLPTHERDGVTSMISLARDQPLPTDIDEALRMYNNARVLSACAHVATVKTLVPSVLARDDPKLSKREKECIAWAANGKTSEEIGKKLHISEQTVVFHVNKVVRKLGVRNRIHAVALSVALGLVS